MKAIFKFFLVVLFSVLATSPQAVSNNLSPFSVDITGIDPAQGTAGTNIFQDVTLEGFEGTAADFVAPAWLEILVLVSPANYPISTFLTQKTLDGIRGLAKAQQANGKGTYDDIFLNDRINSKYKVKEDLMKNYEQFGEAEISSYKLNWGDIAVLPYQDSINAVFAGGATSADITVANGDMWTPNSLIRVQGKTYANGESLVLFVAARNGNTLSVVSTGNNGNEDIPALAVDDRVTRQGTSFNENDVKNESVAQSPTKDYNYAQKFITSVVYSNWMSMTQLFVNYSFSMITNLALQDFRYGQEFSFMFGNRSEFTANSKTYRTTGGLEYYIDQVIEYGTGGGNTDITETDIVDFTKQMRVGNNGSDTRFMWGGSEVISSLNKGVMSDSTKFVQKEYDTVYGLSFTVLYSFFGTINVSYAPLMDQSDYRDKAFLLDMAYIDKFVFQPFRETQYDGVKHRDFDGKAIDLVETCGLVVRNIDTHFIFEVKA
ncbi:DUF5309 family protein [Draconibacterium sp.]|uniref:SU10 major capsid protein n=1 Tax=Draconibacterium sp. TaxID=1965318 RepID=UPI003568807D